MKKLFTLLTFCAVTFIALADKQVSGIVVDENDEPIIGATVLLVGTTAGTTTDFDGKYEMSVPDNVKFLKVSYVGKQPQEVPAKTNVRVVLADDAEVIDEIVVTGYQTVGKGQFAGSANTVSAESIEKKGASDISKAMTGETPGLQVVTTSGQPGVGASMRSRGIGSVYASTAPLIILDGMTYNGDISSIAPDDIASYTVLKDATATSIYGTRGANGVIVITTKKGTSGEQGKIDVDVKYGANMRLLPMYDVISSPEEYVELSWQSIYNSLNGTFLDEGRLINAVNQNLFSGKGLPTMYNLWDAKGSALIDGYTGKFYGDVKRKNHYQTMDSWKKAIFRVGQKFDGNVRISGGSEKTTYYTSFGYLKDEGYYIGSDFNRFSMRSNLEHQAKKWMKGSLDMSYAYSEMNAVGQGSNMNNGFAYVNGIPPIYPVYLYNEDGSIQVDPKTGDKAFDYGMSEGSGRGFGSGINPAGALRYDRDQTIQHQLAANATLEFKILPVDGLKFTVNAGLQYIGATNSEHTNAFYGDAAGIGRISKTQYNIMSISANQLITYTKQFDSHSVDVLAGHETNFFSQGIMAGSMSHVAVKTGAPVLEWGNAVKMTGMTSYTIQEALDSYFLNGNYIYDEKYGVTFNYRADGSSKFAKGHRWGHFGSVGAMWNFTREDFMSGQDILKNGKFRASWGVLGNQGLNGNYLMYDKYDLRYGDGETAYVWGYKGSDKITWEKTSQVDIGLEFDIDKYLSVEFDYFYKYTYDMLMPRYVAPSQGYSYTWVNGGSMSNNGVEFQFNIHAVNQRNVKLDIRLNGAYYRNEIKSLPDFADTENDAMSYNGGMAIGHSLYDYALPEYAGVNPENGQALYVAYYDANLGSFGYTNASERHARGEKGTNYISNVFLYKEEHPEADIQTTEITEYPYAGANYKKGITAEPALDGGFGFDLEAYGVTLDVACSYRLGGYGIDYQYAELMSSDKVGRFNWHTDIRNAWTANNTNTDVPRLSNGTDQYANSISSRFLISNSYLSLNNIRLGYNFPKKLLGDKNKFHLNQLNIYVSADNLAIASARKGYNPMTSFSGSSNSYQYTPLSTVMGGIKLQF